MRIKAGVESAIRRRPGNLPVELTSFVGRRRELGEVRPLLSQTRLLTLTGSGGAGKTRLALRAASDVGRQRLRDLGEEAGIRRRHRDWIQQLARPVPLITGRPRPSAGSASSWTTSGARSTSAEVTRLRPRSA